MNDPERHSDGTFAHSAASFDAVYAEIKRLDQLRGADQVALAAWEGGPSGWVMEPNIFNFGDGLFTLFYSGGNNTTNEGGPLFKIGLASALAS